MRNSWAVCKREFASFFLTPVGYIIVGTYAAISGLGFAASFIKFCQITVAPSEFGYEGIPDFEELMLSQFLVFCGQLMLFIGPLITMRLLAEERNRGTMELLLTHPLRDRDIVFGKYLASLGIVTVLMGVVAVYLMIIGQYTEVEPAVLVFGLVTVFLMSAAFMSLGLFVSALTGSQITAAILTFALWFISYILGTFADNLPEAMTVPQQWAGALQSFALFVYGIFRQLAIELPLDGHAEQMTQGIFEPADIAYYLLFISLFLFLTFRALESRKWRA
ncbi:MAG: ABC transporter permease subunit [Candidatus Hydrogenedentes bacterium]|nr:ABC transporter permease subunit [Candidatus Hydrogenedentota bacterium]